MRKSGDLLLGWWRDDQEDPKEPEINPDGKHRQLKWGGNHQVVVCSGQPPDGRPVEATFTELPAAAALLTAGPPGSDDVGAKVDALAAQQAALAASVEKLAEAVARLKR